MTRTTWTVAALAAAMTLPLMARAEADKNAQKLWKSKCATCHGADGKGQTEQGKKLGVLDYTDPAWQKAHSDAELKKGISEGVKGMEGYKDKLSAEQIEWLVVFVRGLK